MIKFDDGLLQHIIACWNRKVFQIGTVQRPDIGQYFTLLDISTTSQATQGNMCETASNVWTGLIWNKSGGGDIERETKSTLTRISLCGSPSVWNNPISRLFKVGDFTVGYDIKLNRQLRIKCEVCCVFD